MLEDSLRLWKWNIKTAMLENDSQCSLQHWVLLFPRQCSWGTHWLVVTQQLDQVTWSLFIVNIIDRLVIPVISNNFPVITVIVRKQFSGNFLTSITIISTSPSNIYQEILTPGIVVIPSNSSCIMYFVCQTWCVFTFLKYFLHAFSACKYLDCAWINLGCKIVCL